MFEDAILGNKHHVTVVWGELGLGKTTLMLKWLLYIVMRFKYHALYDGWKPPMLDKSGCDHWNPKQKGVCEHWQEALNKVDFTFWEISDRIKSAVKQNVRLAVIGWDDLAVYFHRSNIQYMHPAVKDFFSKYNFIRPYLANLIITAPDVNFVPEQLMSFCTGDVWVTARGKGDFDRSKLRRSFWGQKRSWTKHYDGYDVHWGVAPNDVYQEYSRVRHEHALEAFERPEEIFVTTMPKAKEFAEEESLF